MEDPLVAMLCLMGAMGLLGGLTNYVGGTEQEPDPKKPAPSLWRSLIWGVSAAFLVPLFLNMMSSDLLDTLLAGTAGWGDLFVFSGFCLLAGISSRAFVTNLTDRILNQVADTQRLAKETAGGLSDVKAELEPVVESLTEPNGIGVLASKEPAPLKPEEAQVLGAFLHGKWRIRTLDGVAEQAGVPIGEAAEVLAALSSTGYVKKLDRPTGTRWSITHSCQNVLESTRQG